MFKRTFFAAALAVSVSLPAGAQDIATRIFRIENQIRELTGQIEELNNALRQLQKQIAASKGAGSGTLEEVPATAQPKLKKLASSEDAGVEQIEDTADTLQLPKKKQSVVIMGADSVDESAGSLALPQDGEAAIGETETAAAAVPAVTSDAVNSDIENVALTPATESPEALYERHYEALLRRQFTEAEAGFRDFLEKYPQHNLAGSAQYQLGETFYAQGNYQDAARNFLQAYKTYPKSRRAPDSLLKLGLSLRKLGQKDQACAALNSVGTEFPRAVEAKKRAAAEYKRAGC